MPVLQPPNLAVASHDFAGVVTKLAVTWQHPRSRVISPIGLLTHDVSGSYRFRYIHNARNVQGFRPLVGFPSLDRAYESEQLFPLFAQRVMSPRRPDYLGYLKTLGLERNASPWEVLALSGGRRTGDTIQLVPAPVPLEGDTWEIDFLVHGVRHMINRPIVLNDSTICSDARQLEASLEGLAAGDQLHLISDSTNEANPNAQLIVTNGGVPIGFLPDLFTEDFVRLDRGGVRCEAVVVNNAASPWHMRVLARLTCKVPENFAFFSSESWIPIA